MNEMQTIKTMLPESLPELSKFVLVGREKLTAVRAEIRAIHKVGLAHEVYEQKLSEAQDIADAVLDAEMQIGKLTMNMEKSKGGRPSETMDNAVQSFKPKRQALEEIGLSERQANRFETLYKHPDAVEKAKAIAREEGSIVTRQAVFNEINRPHVANNSHDDEWYTPAQFIEAARTVMGGIDLDPASNEYANETVKAGTYYNEATDGLSQTWFGRVWLNPPYSAALIQSFAEKLTTSNFEQAIVLVNNATDTAWFRKMVERASAIVFTTGRIKFCKRDSEKGSPLQGQAFLYYGDRVEDFLKVFSEYGWGLPIIKPA